jgi:hypothetical protein
MTESGPELRSVILELGNSVDELRNDLKGVSRQLTGLKRSNQRHRAALIAATIGLVLDLVISGVLIYQKERQDCTNSRSREFFAAEVRKVQGQVAGLTEIQKNPTDRKKGNDGFNQFISASEGYLREIHNLSKC